MDAHQKGTIRTASQAAISSPPSSPLHNHHATVAVPSLTLLTNTLSKVHTLLRDAKCPAAVIRQFFQYANIHFYSYSLIFFFSFVANYFTLSLDVC